MYTCVYYTCMYIFMYVYVFFVYIHCSSYVSVDKTPTKMRLYMYVVNIYI